MHPFVEDIKRLYSDGIVISVAGVDRVFHGGLLAFLADNLAAHLVGGFKENFSFALRICRSCMNTRDQSQTCFLERDCVLRTAETMCFIRWSIVYSLFHLIRNQTTLYS